MLGPARRRSRSPRRAGAAQSRMRPPSARRTATPAPAVRGRASGPSALAFRLSAGRCRPRLFGPSRLHAVAARGRGAVRALRRRHAGGQDQRGAAADAADDFQRGQRLLGRQRDQRQVGARRGQVGPACRSSRRPARYRRAGVAALGQGLAQDRARRGVGGSAAGVAGKDDDRPGSNSGLRKWRSTIDPMPWASRQA